MSATMYQALRVTCQLYEVIISIFTLQTRKLTLSYLSHKISSSDPDLTLKIFLPGNGEGNPVGSYFCFH